LRAKTKEELIKQAQSNIFFSPMQAKFVQFQITVNVKYCKILKYSVFMLHISAFLPKVE